MPTAESFFGKKKAVGARYYLLTACLALGFTAVLLVRATELIASVARSPLYTILLVTGYVSLASLFISPPRTMGFYARRVLLLGVVLAQFKMEWDYQIMVKYSLAAHSAPVYARFLRGYVAIVTGANSGTGYAMSEQLAMLGATVVMACRSQAKCDAAAAAIRESVYKVRSPQGEAAGGIVTASVLDLDDLRSVRDFSRRFMRQHKRLDFLVLNAGAVPPPGSRTAQGFESCLGSMHLGHAALTRWLGPVLSRRPAGAAATSAARVLYVGSQAYMTGSFDVSLFQGNGRGDLHGEVTDNCGSFGPLGLLPCCPIGRCPHTNGYGRAKLANILHVHELQRRHDLAAAKAWPRALRRPRRLVALAMHPGAVHTNIHPFLAASVMQYVLRSPEQASRIMMHALLSDTIAPGSFLDAVGRAHDLQGFHEQLKPKHLEAYPEASGLHFTFKNAIDVPSWDLSAWNKATLLSPGGGVGAGGVLQNVTKAAVAQRLWDVTEKIIQDFERGRLSSS